MPKIKYEEKKFAAETEAMIQRAEQIVTEYAGQGFSLTLRQLYYQFVARGLIANTEKSYKRIGNIVSDARRAGRIDWDAIEDRTRHLRLLSAWDSPQSILESARQSYHRDLWETQDLRMQVWIEKDALIGVIEGVCNELDVPHFSCRGYVSDSEMWHAAMRMRAYKKPVIVLHLGDHDPSGIDMTRDISERLRLFSGKSNIKVRRIALTMEQVEGQSPPPNPAKVTDSRYESYRSIYGDESWELDALEPSFIADLIRVNIENERDEKKWDKAKSEQEQQREDIKTAIQKWDELFKTK